jgi:hypothetical protein
MIARHEDTPEQRDIWARLAAPLPLSEVQWRQQGKPKARDGKFFAPFVAYIDAQFVRDRLDMVVPGEWDLTLELLPALTANGDGEAMDEPCAFKARLQVLGTIREDVGTGRDYKNASTDAFKRAAVRFGIGHELYTDYEILWVQVDSDSKYAKPVEDPGAVYARRQQRGSASPRPTSSGPAAPPAATRAPVPADGTTTKAGAASATEGDVIPDGSGDPMVVGEPSCPKCGGRVWDNRLSKRNPKAPDFVCRRKGQCDGVIWPARANGSKGTKPAEYGPDDEYNEEHGF